MNYWLRYYLDDQLRNRSIWKWAKSKIWWKICKRKKFIITFFIVIVILRIKCFWWRICKFNTTQSSFFPVYQISKCWIPFSWSYLKALLIGFIGEHHPKSIQIMLTKCVKSNFDSYPKYRSNWGGDKCTVGNIIWISIDDFHARQFNKLSWNFGSYS